MLVGRGVLVGGTVGRGLAVWVAVGVSPGLLFSAGMARPVLVGPSAVSVGGWTVAVPSAKRLEPANRPVAVVAVAAVVAARPS